VAQDAAGNDNTAATQFTIVYDNTPPSVVLSDDHPDEFVKGGDQVLITATFTEANGIDNVNKPKITIGTLVSNADMTSTTDNLIWTYTWDVPGEVDETVNVSIAATDVAGNANTDTGGKTEYTIQNTPPTLTGAYMQSDHVNDTWARTGSKVTLYFSSGKNIKNISVFIAGVNVTGNLNLTSGKTFNTYYVMDGGKLEGIIPFSINYTNMAGIAGGEVNQTTGGGMVTKLVTFDKTPPELNSVTISSDNIRPDKVGIGGRVNIKITGSEIIEMIDAKIGTAEPPVNVATITGSGKNWKASYEMTGADINGDIRFEINYSDLAGNEGVLVTATTDGGKVEFNRDKPILTEVSIVSDNEYNTDHAKVGDEIILNFVSNKPIDSVHVTINSKPVTAVNLSGNGWEARYTMSASDSDNDGAGKIIPFTINFIDYYRNRGVEVTTTTPPVTSVIFDKTPPTKPVVSGTTPTMNQKPTWSWTPGVGGSGDFRYKLNESDLSVGAANTTDNSFTPSTDLNAGSHTLYVQERDDAGNWSQTGSSIITIDISPPILSPITMRSNNPDPFRAKTGNTITIDFTANELVNIVSVTINGQPAENITNITGNRWKANIEAGFTSSIPLFVPFTIECSDMAGNITTVTHLSANYGTTDESYVIFHKSAPEINGLGIMSDNNNNTNPRWAKVGDVVAISMSFADYVKNVSVRIINTKEPTSVRNATVTGHFETWYAYYTMVSSDSEGEIKFTVDYEDLAGNAGTQADETSAPHSVVFLKTPPTASVAFDQSVINNSNKEAVSLTISGGKEGYGYEYQITGPGFDWGNGVIGPGTEHQVENINLNSFGDGLVTLKVILTDYAGNTGPEAYASVQKDATAPSGYSVIIEQSHINLANQNELSFIFTGAEINALCEYTITSSGGGIPISGGPVTITSSNHRIEGINVSDLADGTLTLTTKLIDPAGNEGPDSTAIVLKDTNPPAGYQVSFVQPVVNSLNQSSASFTYTGAEINAAYNYILTSDGGGSEITGSGNIASASGTIENINVSGLGNGELKLEFTLTDPAGNTGVTAEATVEKDAELPSGYSVKIDQEWINAANSLLSFTFTGTANHIGHEYNYTISSSGGGVPLTGTDKITSTSQTILDINVGSLNDGTLLLSLTLTSEAGNTGDPVTDEAYLDQTIPFLTSVSIRSNYLNTGWVRPDSLVIIDFTASEIIIVNSVKILGKDATVTNLYGNVWQASYRPASVDTKGNVTFAIDFSDAAGNAVTHSTPTDGSSVEFDNEKPGLSNVTIKSDHLKNPDRARIASQITIEFTASEIIEQVNVRVNNRYASVENYDTETRKWRALYYLPSTDPEDTIAFTINYRDLAGNSGEQVSAATDGEVVIFDKTRPVFDSVSISSNNAFEKNLATSGDQITILIKVSEPVEEPVVTINGLPAASITGGPEIWYAARVLMADENNGLIPFTIDIDDLAGNPGTTRFNSTDGTTVTFDDKEPGISNVTLPSGVYKVGDIIPVLIRADNINYIGLTIEVNGKEQILVNNLDNTYSISYLVEEGDNQIFSAGSIPALITLKDPAGNTTSRNAVNSLLGTVTIDSHIPRIAEISSNAETDGILKIGDLLRFDVKPVVKEEGLIIKPLQYNNTELTWRTDDNGETYYAVYEVSEGDATQSTPLQPGEFTISDQAGNTGSPWIYADIGKTIYASRPSVRVKGTVDKCDYGQTVPVTFEFTGIKPFELTYHDGLDEVGPFMIDAYEYRIDVLEGAYTLVELTDSTGNVIYSAIENAVITVHPLPIVSFEVTGSPYNAYQPADDLNKYVDPPGGIIIGEGVVTNGIFYPMLVDPGEGQQTIIPVFYVYSDQKGCRDTAFYDILVYNTQALISNLENHYCKYSPATIISGSNPTNDHGWFTINTPAGWTDHGNNRLTIDPLVMKAGTHTLIYSYDDGGITYNTTRNFTIDSVGVDVDFGSLSNSYCIDATGVNLQAVNLYPIGGTGHFSGPASGFTSVLNSNTALFEPSKVVKPDSIYSISYYYRSPLGCVSDTITRQVTVNALPVVDFVIRDNYNYHEPPVMLIGNEGGIFSGTGGIVVDNILYPNRINPGPITISYYYKDTVTGCDNSVSKQSRIRSATEIISGIESIYCYSDETIEVLCFPADSTSVEGEFYSRKGAVTSTGLNHASYSILEAGHGIDTLFYRYVIGETPYEVYAAVFIDSIGPVSIIGLDDQFCEGSRSVLLQGYLEDPPLGTRRLTYSGNINAFESSGGVATFSPAYEEPGNYEITFKFTSTSSGCYREITRDVTINRLPVLDFDLPGYYNIDEPPMDLSGSPSNGIFTGPGILANRFYPAEAGAGLSQITYSYTDGNICSNTTSRSVIVVGADGSINGLPDFICIDSEPLTITGTANNGSGGIFTGKGINNLEQGSAIFDPSAAGKGIHMITFRYLFADDGETELYISKNIEVDSIGIVEIFGFNDNLTYCHTDGSVNLTASPAGGVFGGGDYILLNRFHPSLASPGTTNPVSYTFRNTVSGCSVTGTKDINVNPVPNIYFSVIQSCSDLNTEPVEFKNNTISDDEISDWLWKFDTYGETSTEYETGFLYLTSGPKLVTLRAETINGCYSQKDSIIIVGLIPKANFTWQNECVTGDETVFTSTTNPVNIVRYRWEFPDGSVVDGGSEYQTARYTFNETGIHNVKMVIESTDECIDTLMKQVYIQPYIKISGLDEAIYFENFESGKGGWDARSIVEHDHYSWKFGQPDGDVINFASSGQHAWFTDIDFHNQRSEKSHVLSPCFDLTAMEKPMLKFNIWSSPEAGRDGAVVQYDLNGRNIWETLGSVDDGIGWYNSSAIQSQPGGQFRGWSESKMQRWESARVSLDAIKEEQNVRFRIAYAADGNALNPFDGFAFDDVWIGNRKREVLVEYFTNNSTGITIDSDLYLQEFGDQNKSDINPIHYHTSSPPGDPLNSLYPAGPSAREFFYGISTIPYGLINGSKPFDFGNASVNQQVFNREKLKDPLFGLSVRTDSTTNSRIEVAIKALDDFSGLDLVLHIAIVQNAVEITDAPNGSSKFYNVLRRFLPDPGGKSIPGTMTSGHTTLYSVDWNPPEADILKEMKVIAFIQNIETGEIYQSGYFDLADIVTYSDRIGIPVEIKVYPNPAVDYIWIDSPLLVERVSVVDISGRVVSIHKPDSYLFSIPVNRFRYGVYMLRIETPEGTAIKKFVKQ
jgi:hypothetical protein